MGHNAVVPFAVKVMGRQSQVSKLFVADLNLGFVMVGVQSSLNNQARARRGTGDEVDDGLMTHQGLPAPVLRDEAEQTMLNLVPLARARGKVADQEFHLQLVGQFLERHLPQPRARAVTAAAIGGNQQFASSRKATMSHLTPPAADAVDGKLG